MKQLRGSLNKAITLAEIDATFKVISISTNEIAAFRFLRKIDLKRKLTLKATQHNAQLHIASCKI